MASRWNWTLQQEDYLERLYNTWHNEFVKTGKLRKNVLHCPVQHNHAYKRGYCLLSERQWIIAYFRAEFHTGDLSDRAIWTKYGRVNGFRRNGKLIRRGSKVSDSYESPNGFQLTSNNGSDDPLYAWERMLQAAGIDHIGNGVSRHVYDLGDGNVLKVQNRGEHANEKEINLWTEVEGTKYEKFFAPIVAADKAHRWLVMAKAETFNHDMYGGEAIVDDLRDVIRHFGLYDIHFGNVGIYDGQPVLIDYAW